MRRRFLKYGVALAVGLAIALAVAWNRGLFDQTDPVFIAQYLSDAFFVPSCVLLGAGLLAFVASDGFFDMLGFGVKKLFSLLHRDESRFSETFYDYKRMRQAKRTGGFGFLLVVGGIFLAAAIAFLVLYTILTAGA